jgi:8-oxo-dGTP diphosphatase
MTAVPDLAAHMAAAARPGRGEQACPCCNGKGSHQDGAECDPCDGQGIQHKGDPGYCPGREPRRVRRRHWRQAAAERMSVGDLLGLHSDEALRRQRALSGNQYLGHSDATRVGTLYDRKAAELAGNPAWQALDEPIRSGTIDPVLLARTGSGHTVVSEGGHRIVRAHQLGVSHLPVSWDPGSQAHRDDWDDPGPMQHQAAAEDTVVPEGFKALYHGTSREKAGELKASGFDPVSGHIYPAQWPVLTENRTTAEAYSHAGGAVVELHVPHADFWEHSRSKGKLWPAQDHIGGPAYAVREHLPASYVAAVHDVHVRPDYPHEGRRRHQAAEDTSYRMLHEGPDPDHSEGLHEIGSGKIWPKDFHERWHEYALGATSDSLDKVFRSRGWPSRKVWAYRALPSPHREVNTGDWVSTSKEYALQEARHSYNRDDDYPVVKFQARAEHLRNEGNSLDEWSYHGPPVKRALVHHSGGKNHRGKGPRGAGTDARAHEHEPPEMYQRYEEDNRAHKQRLREERQQRLGSGRRGHPDLLGHFEAAPVMHMFAWAPGGARTAAEMYHGSDNPESFSRFDFSKKSRKHEDEEWSARQMGEEPPESRWWNSRIGSHFTSEHSMASEAGKSGPDEGHVYHVDVRMKHPKDYPSEHDLAHEGFDWARGHGYKGLVSYHETGHADALQQHPKSQEIAEGFRRHLQHQGHDGITYGNEFEQPIGHRCAIVFHPDQAKITETHGAYEPCRYDEPDDMEHEGARHTVKMIDLYHHTTPEEARQIYQQKKMISKENTGSIFFTTDPDSEYAAAFGEGAVHVRMPHSHLNRLADQGKAWQDDEFPSGEQHWAIHHSGLRPEHFIRDDQSHTAARTENVRHILNHYKPYDFDTWDEVRDNIIWDHPEMRAMVDDVRRNGVRRPVPIDYEQDPPVVRNGHTRVLAAEMAGLTRVPVRQHEWMDPDDPNPVTGKPNVSDEDWHAGHHEARARDVHPELHRGIAIKVPADVHEITGDESRPVAERAGALVDHVTREGMEPLGQHWSTDEREARGFTRYNSPPAGAPGSTAYDVVLHAKHPGLRHVITDPGWREEHEVNEGEDEHPLERGTPLDIRGVSWRLRGAGDWTTHRFSEPQEHTAAAIPEYGPEPERHYAPEDWPQEKRMEHNDREFEKTRQWKAHIKRGLSLGHITAPQAKSYKYYFGGHETDNRGDPKWREMPQEMYHVTTDLGSVRRHGLKTRAELAQHRGGHGLGGGEDDSISVTDDPGMGHHILRALHEFHDVVNHRFTPAQMWQHAREGRGASRPFHEDLASYYQSGWKEGDELPRGLQDNLEGKETKSGGMLGTREDIERQHGPGWEPDDEGVPHNRDLHYMWRRKADPDRHREQSADFYKNFATFREHAGGHPDPMFFATDTKAFAAKDPRNFAMLHVSPKPGAQGYPLSSLGEWRTGTGDALHVHHYEQYGRRGHLHTAVWVHPPDLLAHFGAAGSGTFPNPYHGTSQFGGSPEWGSTWFHGTRGDPEFGERRGHGTENRLRQRPEERQMISGWPQPNQLLGVHFSPLHEVAHKFAPSVSGSPTAIVHARLHFSNPAHYDTEGHLNNAIARWGQQHYPHWHNEKLNGQMSWNYSDNEGTHRDFRDTKSLRNGDAAQSILQWHPHLPEILHGFRQHLREQGHHGITYGNEVEGPYSTDATRGGQASMKYIEKNKDWPHGHPKHISAIAQPEDIETTHVEHIAPWREEPEPHQRTWEDVSDQDESDEMRDRILAYHREHGGAYPGGMQRTGSSFDWSGLTHGRYDVPTEAVHALRQHEQRNSGKYPRLADEVAERGLDEPLEVSLHDDGRVVLRGGSHRVNIAHDLGHPTVPVQVVDMRHAGSLVAHFAAGQPDSRFWYGTDRRIKGNVGDKSRADTPNSSFFTNDREHAWDFGRYAYPVEPAGQYDEDVYEGSHPEGKSYITSGEMRVTGPAQQRPADHPTERFERKYGAAGSLAGHMADAPLQNPHTGSHEWFHGTRAKPEDIGEHGLADPADVAPGRFETPQSEGDDPGHWNRLLGSHFTADHDIAEEFARGEHEGSSNEGYADEGEEPHEGIIHARLGIKNPKHYASEHDMDHEAYEHEHAAGNHPINHLRDYEDDEEYGEEERNDMWPNAMRIHRDFGTSEIPAGTYGHHGSQFGMHPMRTAWLNTHPDKYEIAMRFKQRLKDQGHDGITYGNEYEKGRHGTAGNTSAIAFEPHQVNVTQHHHADLVHEPSHQGPALASLVQHFAAWAPSSGIFGPTTGLDPVLFNGDQLRPEVRRDVMERLDQALRVDGGAMGSEWQDRMRVYLAGGSASEWAGSRPGEKAQDLDILIGLQDTDTSECQKVNRALREQFNDDDWHPAFGGHWQLTGYCNPQSFDIVKIRPYAAWDLTSSRWAVRPPHLPGHSVADFDPALIQQARAVAAEARAILRLPEPYRTRQARSLWNRIHEERSVAFSPEGGGWQDPANVIEKWLAYAPRHLLDKIRELAFRPDGLVAHFTGPPDLVGHFRPALASLRNPPCHFCGEPLDDEDVTNDSSSHDECERMNWCEPHQEHHDEPGLAEQHNDTYTEWGSHLPFEHGIHRGFPVQLPAEVHEAVHDEKRPAAERADILRRHLDDNPSEGMGLQRRLTDEERYGKGGHFGVHWTDSEPHARGWGEDDYYEGHGNGGVKPHVTHVVLHAASPAEEHIEHDPEELERRHMWGFEHPRSEREVPLRVGAPVHLTGISWKHGGQDQWERHDFPGSFRHTATAASDREERGDRWHEFRNRYSGDIHRGIIATLPDRLHQLVHDEGVPREDRARALSEHFRGAGLGMHWTPHVQIAQRASSNIADRDYPPWTSDKDDNERYPKTHIMFHARQPAQRSVLRNREELERHQVGWSYSKDEDETPVKPGSPMKLTGISWKLHEPEYPMEPYEHHDFPKPVPHTAAEKPVKDKDEVNYRKATGKERCGNCVMFRLHPPDFESGACTLVRGLINEDDTCDEWYPEEKGKTAGIADPRDRVVRMHPRDLMQYVEAYRTDDEGGKRHRKDLADKIRQKGYQPRLHGGMSGNTHFYPPSSPITLVHEDEHSYFLEGNHRVHALNDVGYDKKVPVLVKDRRTPGKTAARGAAVWAAHDQRWMHGHCGTYAHALRQLDPSLRIGIVGTGPEDDPQYVEPEHYFAHDDRHAYDASGRHQLPYAAEFAAAHGVRPAHGHELRESHDIGDVWDLAAENDSADGEDLETNLAQARSHARRHRVLGAEKHRLARTTTASIAMPGEYGDDNTAPPEGEIHRGVPLFGLEKYHPEVHRFIHDESVPVADRAARLMQHLGPRLEKDKWGGGGVGKHWSTSERTAQGFATTYEHSAEHPWHEFHQDPSVTRVVFHAAPPKQSHMITSPKTKMRRDILPTTHGEREVPLRNRAPVTLTGISWGRNEKDAPLTRHDFSKPIRVKAAAGRQFVHQGESPLDYTDSTWLKPQRMAITDSEAGEHPKGDTYFAETHRQVMRNPDTGRALKKPRTITTPGAAPGTVAFADYTRPHPDVLYINYMKTRKDHGGQGLARDLVDHLISQHPDARHVDFGKMMHPAVGAIKDEMARRYPDRHIRGKVYYASRTASVHGWSPDTPLYHGALRKYKKGTVLSPEGRWSTGSIHSGDYVYATTSPESARYFGSMHDFSPQTDLKVHVHRVVPVGDIEPHNMPGEREEYSSGNYRAKALLVIGHGAPHEAAKFLASGTHGYGADSPDYVHCGKGHEHWGRFGSADLLYRFTHPADGLYRYLLHKRDGVDHKHDHDLWDLPGGGRKSEQEKHRDTAEREFREEAGPMPGGSKRIRTFTDDCGKGDGPVPYVYKCFTVHVPEIFLPDGSAAELPQETAGLAWFSRQEIARMAEDGLLERHLKRNWKKIFPLQDRPEPHRGPVKEAEASLLAKVAAMSEGYTTCDQGHQHWGRHGAAGLLVRHQGDDGQVRYLLQKRSPYVQHGATWSTPGGAMHQGEAPEHAARRETEEEMGRLPGGLAHRATVTDDHGGWAYHTVIMDSPSKFAPKGEPDREHGGHGWFTPEEMKKLQLHPGFAASWGKISKEAASYRGKFPCKDCGWDTNSAAPGVRTENYLVHDKVWQQAGMEKMSGNLCVGCLENRIGRKLHAGDFPAVPVNDLSESDSDKAYSWRTDRLKDRMRRTAARGYDLNERSAMISLDVPPDVSAKIAHPGGVTDHHVTIAYLGPDVGDDAYEEACRRAAKAASGLDGPVRAVLRGADTFPPSESSGGKRPAYVPVMLSQAGHGLRRELEDLSASQFPFVPHVCLAYLDKDEPVPARITGIQVIFPELSVHRGTDVKRFPFGRSLSREARYHEQAERFWGTCEFCDAEDEVAHFPHIAYNICDRCYRRVGDSVEEAEAKATPGKR